MPSGRAGGGQNGKNEMRARPARRRRPIIVFIGLSTSYEKKTMRVPKKHDLPKENKPRLIWKKKKKRVAEIGHGLSGRVLINDTIRLQIGRRVNVMRARRIKRLLGQVYTFSQRWYAQVMSVNNSNATNPILRQMSDAVGRHLPTRRIIIIIIQQNKKNVFNKRAN